VRELEFLDAAEVTILSDRRRRGPYGLQGGGDGKPGRSEVAGAPLASKTRFNIQRNERLRVESPGGGGWGRE